MDFDKIKAAQAEAMAALKVAIPSSDLKAQKRFAIAEQTINFASTLAHDMSNVASYERKVARIFRKKKYTKAEANRRRLIAMLNFEMNRMQLRRVMEQPIPKLPKGVPHVSVELPKEPNCE